MQSGSPEQVSLQAVAPHTSGVQLVVLEAGQVPLPLQLAAAVATPLVQLALRHTVAVDGYEQAPVPLTQALAPQVPPVVQAAEQQMPPRQIPLAQPLGIEQVPPAGALAAQAVPLQ